MKSLRSLAVSWCVLGLASGCGPVVAGSGVVAEERRTVGAWRTLAVADGIHTEVARGAPGVVLTTDDNLLEQVETVLEGTVLHVRVKAWYVSTELGISARVSGEVLEGVAASGGSTVTGAATPAASTRVDASGRSKVTLTALDTPELHLDASGASTVTLSGRTASLRANASGASLVRARELTASTADVSGSGASSLELNVASTLTGSLSGASHLTWVGGAASNVSTSGGSTATRGD